MLKKWQKDLDPEQFRCSPCCGAKVINLNLSGKRYIKGHCDMCRRLVITFDVYKNRFLPNDKLAVPTV